MYVRPVWRLLLGFRMSLSIISGVTWATPGCTAFPPWNVCSHPFFSCAFGRSPQELPLEYQVDVLFMNISVKMVWIGAPICEYSGIPSQNRQSHSKSTRTKNIRNLHSKKVNFLFIDPLAVLRVFLNASRYSEFTHVIFPPQNQMLTKI